MNRIKRIECAAALGLVLALLCSFASYFFACGQLRRDVVRLHVLAHSDAAADQAVKLRVRDALLESGSALFSGAATPETAAAILESQRAGLEQTANRVLAGAGMPYRARLTLTREFFTTRSYGAITLPAGRYLAVRVILGDGAGQNWWCVMFPPLCLPAASESRTAERMFTPSENAVLHADETVEIRLKVVELFETWKEKVRKQYARTSELPVEQKH
ncbi:MAG: stage II sporulation protein R [Clostridia bacterium]|nr:stage II sporulation protein R [Clostridia bacterium]